MPRIFDVVDVRENNVTEKSQISGNFDFKDEAQAQWKLTFVPNNQSLYT